MLPTKRRIKKDSFSEILKKGVFVHSTNIYLCLLPKNTLISAKNEENLSLFGFVVSSKIKKTSVGRHFLKRKLSGSVEEILKSIKPGFYCLFFAKKDMSALPYSEIKEEIINLLKKAKMLSE
jgi:ribonuclease P protein component